MLGQRGWSFCDEAGEEEKSLLSPPHRSARYAQLWSFRFAHIAPSDGD